MKKHIPSLLLVCTLCSGILASSNQLFCMQSAEEDTSPEKEQAQQPNAIDDDELQEAPTNLPPLQIRPKNLEDKQDRPAEQNPPVVAAPQPAPPIRAEPCIIEAQVYYYPQQKPITIILLDPYGVAHEVTLIDQHHTLIDGNRAGTNIITNLVEWGWKRIR
jgi:hypothetical protein